MCFSNISSDGELINKQIPRGMNPQTFNSKTLSYIENNKHFTHTHIYNVYV